MLPLDPEVAQVLHFGHVGNALEDALELCHRHLVQTATAMLALAAVPVFLGSDPSPSSIAVLADDPTPADPFCPENVPPPCSR